MDKQQTSPVAALIKVAEGLESLAKTIESQEQAVQQQQKLAATTYGLSAYGSISDQQDARDLDPLTKFIVQDM